MTTKQTSLIHAITRRLSTQASYKDLLRAAAREAGMTELEAIVELDTITTVTQPR